MDANVFVSAWIRPAGPPGQILKLFIKEKAFELILSNEILEEIRRSIYYPKVRKHIQATNHEIELGLASLELLADSVEAQLPEPVVLQDPDDDKYLAAAIEGCAEYVVSGDDHLLQLGEYEGIKIVTPRAFWELLKA